MKIMPNHGSRNKNAVLNEVQVEVIKEMINEGVALREIMIAFNINRNTLHALSSGRTWKHVEPDNIKGARRTDIKRFNEGYAEKLEGIKWTEPVEQ